jgi:hypothetical protein
VGAELFIRDSYKCLQRINEDPGTAQTFAEAEILECLDPDSYFCEYLAYDSDFKKCTCPLRKMFAINYKSLYE